MSNKHLAKGSTCPPKVKGKLRLYSMEFCPYAERVRLVLLAKSVAHDIVNVHLKNKPDWFLELNAQGLVPTLDTGSQILTESLDICDYLNDQYPDPPLYPAGGGARMREKALISSFSTLISLYYQGMNGIKSYSKYLEVVTPHLKRLESELEKRGTFFGGDQPNMADYMLWPWGERFSLIGLAYGEELPGADEFPRLYAWCSAMRMQGPVEQTVTSPERLYKLSEQYKAGPETVDYDSI